MMIELVADSGASGRVSKKASCKHPYGGIGITVMQNGWYREITEVAPGYPADLAGLRVKDLLIDKTEILGPPGSVVRVTVDRAGEILVFMITRAKVCTE